jgi:CDP-diacylglycerol--serine O-phosphatidyltransferase
MKPRDLMFVLPNAFTVSSIFCGFYAMTLVANNPGPEQFYQAAIGIFFAFFFDGFDGRVARMTRTQSDFGVQLDSLADVCSFGVAPGLLMYQWALKPLGFWGLFISFAFATCGALRLARFNVQAARKVPGSSSYFTGLPIPLGAGMLIALVIANHATHSELELRAPVAIAVMVAVLSLLMVSTVRYRTFKDLKKGKQTLMLVGGLGVLGVGVATLLQPAFIPFAFFSAYLLMGLVEVPLGTTRSLDQKAAGAPAEVDHDADADDDDDEDVLVKP